MSDFIIKNGILKKYTGTTGSVAVVPDGVTAIGDGAFSLCKNLKYVQIPSSVTCIGNSAFYICENLKHVRLSDRIARIGNEAFLGCSSLTSITIPDSITSIGEQTFYGCEHLTRIVLPDSMTRIGNRAFYGCENLTDFHLPDGITSIGISVFGGAAKLTVHWPGTGTITDNTFDDVHCIIAPHFSVEQFPTAAQKRAAVCGFLWETEAFTDEAARTHYVKYAIGQRKKLLPWIFAEDCVSALTFYAEQKKITAANFDAEYMTPATEANATECIAFLLDWKNKHLSQDSVDKQLEKELTKDPFNAADMKKLWSYEVLDDDTLQLTSYKGSETDVLVPERIGKKAVTALGECVFSFRTPSGTSRPADRKTALAQIRTIVLPDGITSIGRSAFSGCNQSTVQWAGRGTIGERAFEGVSCLVLPRISFAVFTDMKSRRAAIQGFLRNTDAYTDAAVRAEYIKYAISQRKKLLSEIFAENLVSALTIYAEQKKITAANFDAEYMIPATEANATECIAFLLDWKNKHLSQDSMDKHLEKELTKDPFNAADMKKLWSYEVLDNDTLRLTSYKGNETDVYVPERIGKKTVTALGDYVFSSRTPSGTSKPADRKAALEQIRTIVLPDGITFIGKEAFRGCDNLTSITLPGSLTSIGEWAFAYCSGLMSIALPENVTSIGKEAFRGCINLTSITIPDRVTDISYWAFIGCKNLTIHASAGSYAETYAKAHHIPFTAK